MDFMKLYNGIKAVESMIFESGFDQEVIRVATTTLYRKRKDLAAFALQLHVIDAEQWNALDLE